MILNLSLFVLGIIVGSFLNVVGLRWNSGLTIGGRSFCVTCKRQLRWWELIPVVSFVLLGGRCRGCRAKISWQYPLVELWTGIVFSAVFYVLNPSTLVEVFQYALVVSVFCIYTVILIYDLHHKIIPDELVYASLGVAILLNIWVGNHSLLDWAMGPVIFLFFGFIWLVSRGRAVGLGDAKLGASIGFLLGAAQGLSAIVLAFWIGTAVVLIYMALGRVSALLIGGKRLTMKSEIPFGPFMVMGALIALIFKLDLLYVSLF
jgi:prepilin signal peptidase PulO-like enzyme (type II secretory pathway)